MKYKKIFIGIVLLSIGLAGCENDLTNLVYQPSKTTTIEGEIPLRAKHYTEEQAASLPNWSGGWEFNPSEQQLKLSNLMPGGEIKNNTFYEVAISGTLSVNQMDAFQFVFTVPGNHDTEAWLDLSSPSDSRTVSPGDFSITGTLKTKGVVVTSGTGDPGDPVTGKPADPYVDTYASNYINSGMLAFTNDVVTVEGDHNTTKAVLSNMVITITEK